VLRWVAQLLVVAPLLWPLLAHASPKPLSMPGARPPRLENGAPKIPERRRGGLIAGVAVSAAAVVAGGLLFIPVELEADGEDGTPLIGWVATGTSLIVFGSVATLVTATFLAHHERWDAPPRVLIGDRHQAERARLQRRRLLRTLAIAGGVAVAGGLAIGIGYAAAAGCSDSQDLECAGKRATVGVAVGGPLAIGGGFAALSSGILLGLHKRHRHRDVAARPLLTVGAGSFTIRF
jgi:hypothetical protein